MCREGITPSQPPRAFAIRQRWTDETSTLQSSATLETPPRRAITVAAGSKCCLRVIPRLCNFRTKNASTKMRMSHKTSYAALCEKRACA